MRYCVRQLLSFTTLDLIQGAGQTPLVLFSLVLHECRERLRAEGVGVFSADVIIRPWPRDVGENPETGYSDAHERIGLEILMSASTD